MTHVGGSYQGGITDGQGGVNRGEDWPLEMVLKGEEDVTG